MAGPVRGQKQSRDAAPGLPGARGFRGWANRPWNGSRRPVRFTRPVPPLAVRISDLNRSTRVLFANSVHMVLGSAAPNYYRIFFPTLIFVVYLITFQRNWKTFDMKLYVFCASKNIKKHRRKQMRVWLHLPPPLTICHHLHKMGIHWMMTIRTMTIRTEKVMVRQTHHPWKRLCPRIQQRVIRRRRRKR